MHTSEESNVRVSCTIVRIHDLHVRRVPTHRMLDVASGRAETERDRVRRRQLEIQKRLRQLQHEAAALGGKHAS